MDGYDHYVPPKTTNGNIYLLKITFFKVPKIILFSTLVYFPISGQPLKIQVDMYLREVGPLNLDDNVSKFSQPKIKYRFLEKIKQKKGKLFF